MAGIYKLDSNSSLSDGGILVLRTYGDIGHGHGLFADCLSDWHCGVSRFLIPQDVLDVVVEACIGFFAFTIVFSFGFTEGSFRL